MKKRKSPSSSCSSSTSSSCIESPIKPDAKPKSKPKPKPKRVRTKKIPNHDSATSAKSRSSIYRGVTRHRWTGRYEAHLWDKTTWNAIQNKRGRQIYLGAYDNEEDAAHTYDLAALKYWGPATILNFPVETYTKELEEMQKLTKEEFLASLRRRSSGFSRGVSKYRGVARHHHNGRWEARIGRVCGNKYLYLGTYGTQEEAAVAYDMAAIEYRGPNAVTNFDISNYADKLKKVLPEVQVRQDEIHVKQEMYPIPLDEVQADAIHDHQGDELQIDEVHDHQGNKEREDEVHGQQEYENEAAQRSVPKLESIESEAIVVMDPTEDLEHPWDLCLDTNFNIFSFPDIPLEKASEVFDYKGFDDDIECIFDEPFGDNEIVKDALPGSVGLVAQDLKGQDASPSPSSSLSTTSVL